MHIIKLSLIFIIVIMTWGTTWIAVKVVVETIPPLFATGMRFLLISPLLLCLSYFRSTSLLFPKGKRKLQILVTIFYFLIPFTLMLYAGTYVNVIVSSIIFSVMPMITLIVHFLFLKEKIFVIQIVGFCIAFFALCSFLTNEIYIHGYCHFKGILALILAVISHSFIYLMCKIKCCNISVLTFNTLSSLISGIILSSLALLIEHPSFQNFSMKSMLSLFYLANFSGLFGILSFFYLQKKVKIFIASIVFLIFPWISLISEVLFYKYNVSVNEIFVISMLIIGVFLTIIPKIFF